MNIEALLLRIPAILIALTVHEYAHGYVALLMGDTTARNAGRLTLNPIPHLDLFGTIMLLMGPFGWAKPVPVTPGSFTRRRLGMILVGAAGPASNIALAVTSGLLYRYLVVHLQPPLYLSSFFHLFFIINIGLSFFNLLPVPPLDGSHIVAGLLPPRKAQRWLYAMRFVPRIVLALLVAEWVFRIPLFSAVINPLFAPWFTFWRTITFG